MPDKLRWGPLLTGRFVFNYIAEDKDFSRMTAVSAEAANRHSADAHLPALSPYHLGIINPSLHIQLPVPGKSIVEET